LAPNIDAHIVGLRELITMNYEGNIMDLASVTRYFTLNVCRTIAFGTPFGFMDANEDL